MNDKEILFLSFPINSHTLLPMHIVSSAHYCVAAACATASATASATVSATDSGSMRSCGFG